MKKDILWIVGGVFGFIILMFVISFSVMGSTAALAPITGWFEKRIAVNRGFYQIQSYEKFYELAHQIDAIDIKLDAYGSDLDTRQRTECLGLLTRRAGLVAAYNAASEAVTTQGQWRDQSLPPTMQQYNKRICE